MTFDLLKNPGFLDLMQKLNAQPDGAVSESENMVLEPYIGVQEALRNAQRIAVTAAGDAAQKSIADYRRGGERLPDGHWMTEQDIMDLLGEEMTVPTAITAPGTVILPPCVAEDDSFPSMMNHVRAGELGGAIHFQSPVLVGHSHWVRVSGTMSAAGVLTAEVHNTLGNASRNRDIGARESDEPQYKGIANALAVSPSASGARLVCNGQQGTGWSCGYMAGAALLGAPVTGDENACVAWSIARITDNLGLALPAE